MFDVCSQLTGQIPDVDGLYQPAAGTVEAGVLHVIVSQLEGFLRQCLRDTQPISPIIEISLEDQACLKVKAEPPELIWFIQVFSGIGCNRG